MADEHSKSGAPIHRHETPADPAFSGGDPELIEAIDAHITEHFGSPSFVWHEVISPYVHVDVHVVAPTDERPVYTLVTSGMSEKPMEDGSHAELTMLLPSTWPAPESKELERPEHQWPYGLLQGVAQLPHEYETTLGIGHSVPNGDPPEPYAPNTGLCGMVLVPPLLAPEGFETLQVGGREIEFLAVLPLHADEMLLKLDKGLDALAGELDRAGVTEVLDPGRPSVGVRRRRRGLFRR